MATIEQYYDVYWTRDDDVSDHDPTTPERKLRLLQVLREHCVPGDSVLDLGCGAGTFTSWMAEAGYEALGLDLSEKAIAMATRNHPDGSYATLRPDGALPVDDATIAAVWSSEVIEHLLDVKAFLDEIHRVLKPGGVLILTTPFHGLVKNLLITLLKFDRHFKVDGSHIRFFDKKGIQRSLTRSGFRPLSYGGVGRRWPLYRSWFVVAEKM